MSSFMFELTEEVFHVFSMSKYNLASICGIVTRQLGEVSKLSSSYGGDGILV